MKKIPPMKATYTPNQPFGIKDVDGNILDLTDYTITPYIYTLDATPTVYMSGSDAGVIVKSSPTAGQFYWRPLSTTFPTAGQNYNLRFQLVSGSFKDEYPFQDEDLKLVIY